jgi:predicted nucleic acid-binding protein
MANSYDQLRLCFIGLSGAGKSTSAKIVREWARSAQLDVAAIKLAKPLYDIQAIVYRYAGRPPPGSRQDQLLMVDIARHLRRINNRALVDVFTAEVLRSNAHVVVNDDLKDFETDYPVLRSLGFIFIRLWSEEGERLRRLSRRDDLALADERSLWQFDAMAADYTLENSHNDLREFTGRMRGVLDEILAQRGSQRELGGY